MSRINLKQPTAHAYNLFILFHFLLFFFKILYFSTVCNLKSNLLSPWHSQAKLGCLYNLFWYQVWVARCIPFSSAEPVVSWSRGRETRGEPRVAYKLSRVALGDENGCIRIPAAGNCARTRSECLVRWELCEQRCSPKLAPGSDNTEIRRSLNHPQVRVSFLLPNW